MHGLRTLGMVFCLGGPGLVLWADSLAQPDASPVSGCNSPEALAVLTAEELPALLGYPLEQIRLLRYQGQHLSPITLQIDQRDADGRYRLNDTPGPDERGRLLGPNDEIVFRIADRSERRPPASTSAENMELAEIEVKDTGTGQTGWVYAGLSEAPVSAPPDKRITYDPVTDSVETDSYRIGFSRQYPFVIDSFHWPIAENRWSRNVLDTMKIRHRGKMFGLLSFTRTTKDYSSRLVQVKTGPLRTIRRTENHVRVLWKLKTPALYVDYIMMPDSFVMDTIVDIPFNLGLLFSDVETLTTVDWRQAPGLPELTIRSPATTSRLVVDGKMSEEESRFNTIQDTRVSVHSSYGSAFLTLDIPEDFPIRPWLYINDQISVADPPETQPGQFGNFGYRTTGWENIDTEVHHLKFTTCMTTAEVEHGTAASR